MIDNPCDAYIIKKPAPRARSATERKQNVALPNRVAFDDGFRIVAETIPDIAKWIQSKDWLQLLQTKLTQSDFDNLVGQTFQFKLAHRYLQKSQRKLKLKVCKTNKYCLQLVNMKSKYKSGNFRAPVLNFRELFADLFPDNVTPRDSNDPQILWWQTKEKEYSSQRAVEQKQEQIRILQPQNDISVIPLKRKSWKNIKWELWDSKLIKVQWQDICLSGKYSFQPCAHVAGFFLLIWWALSKQLKLKLKVSAKNERLLQKGGPGPINLHPSTDYLNFVRNHWKKQKLPLYCICQTPSHGIFFFVCSF